MLLSYREVSPSVSENARLIGMCTVAGDAEIKDGASIWPGAVVRAENAKAIIGKNCNIQDNVTVHTDKGFPVILGEGVSVGHNAILHGCTIGDNTLIGMGAVILNGAIIGKNCVIGAGAVVRGGMEVPDGSMVLGIPAVIKREVRAEEIETNKNNALEYLHLSKGYENN